MQTSKIIIIGGGNHHNTLGVIRSLGKRNQNFDLLTYGNLKKHYVTSSVYVKFHKEFENPEEIIAFLIEHYSEAVPCVIISCSDIITELLSDNQDQLCNKFLLPGTPQKGKMREIQDKSVMRQMANNRGIRTPETWIFPKDTSRITFPCITKSIHSSHGGKEYVTIIKSKQELEDFSRTHTENFIIQEYINKKEEVQFIGCSVNGGREIIIPGITKIIRSQKNTNTGFLEYRQIDSFWNPIVDKCKDYIKDCEYSGLFSIEFIRDLNDNIYFLECNFRNDGNAYCVTKAGVNLPIIWIKWNKGIDFLDEIKPIKNLIVMPEFQDFKLLLQGKVSPFIWIKDLFRTNCFLEWDKRDIKPFFIFILNKLR